MIDNEKMIGASIVKFFEGVRYIFEGQSKTDEYKSKMTAPVESFACTGGYAPIDWSNVSVYGLKAGIMVDRLLLEDGYYIEGICLKGLCYGDIDGAGLNIKHDQFVKNKKSAIWLKRKRGAALKIPKRQPDDDWFFTRQPHETIICLRDRDDKLIQSWDVSDKGSKK